MYRLSCAVSLVFLTALLASGQQILVYHKPDHPVPPAGSELRKTVVFLKLQCRDGNNSEDASGTGFITAYGDARLPKGTYFDYLVTNRHVALCWNERNIPLEVRSISVRFTTKDGSSREWKISENGNIKWYVSSDDSVDLAVTPIRMPDDFQQPVIPVDDFATKDFLAANGIAEGAQIILSGYFYQFPGTQHIEPIVRQGILSMIPRDEMITTTGKLGVVYLGDVHIFGGNSGSPVLVRMSETDLMHVAEYHFLGIVSGYYYEDQDFNLEIATTVKGKARANSGVAMIVPADQIKALLDIPELKGGREANVPRAADSAQR